MTIIFVLISTQTYVAYDWKLKQLLFQFFIISFLILEVFAWNGSGKPHTDLTKNENI